MKSKWMPLKISTEAPFEYVSKMRASVVVMGHYWQEQVMQK